MAQDNYQADAALSLAHGWLCERLRELKPTQYVRHLVCPACPAPRGLDLLSSMPSQKYQEKLSRAWDWCRNFVSDLNFYIVRFPKYGDRLSSSSAAQPTLLASHGLQVADSSAWQPRLSELIGARAPSTPPSQVPAAKRRPRSPSRQASPRSPAAKSKPGLRIQILEKLRSHNLTMHLCSRQMSYCRHI